MYIVWVKECESENGIENENAWVVTTSICDPTDERTKRVKTQNGYLPFRKDPRFQFK